MDKCPSLKAAASAVQWTAEDAKEEDPSPTTHNKEHHMSQLHWLYKEYSQLRTVVGSSEMCKIVEYWIIYRCIQIQTFQ